MRSRVSTSGNDDPGCASRRLSKMVRLSIVSIGGNYRQLLRRCWLLAITCGYREPLEVLKKTSIIRDAQSLIGELFRSQARIVERVVPRRLSAPRWVLDSGSSSQTFLHLVHQIVDCNRVDEGYC